MQRPRKPKTYATYVSESTHTRPSGGRNNRSNIHPIAYNRHEHNSRKLGNLLRYAKYAIKTANRIYRETYSHSKISPVYGSGLGSTTSATVWGNLVSMALQGPLGQIRNHHRNAELCWQQQDIIQWKTSQGNCWCHSKDTTPCPTMEQYPQINRWNLEFAKIFLPGNKLSLCLK